MKLEYAAFIVAVLLLLGWAGSADYRSELQERDHYCAMVADGHWPDYRGIAAKECT